MPLGNTIVQWMRLSTADLIMLHAHSGHIRFKATGLRDEKLVKNSQ
jgi:hypothetical protein